MQDQCTVEGCRSGQKARGWCLKHYTRWKRHGDPAVRLRRESGPCQDLDCDRWAVKLGYCDMHYRRYQKYGSTAEPPRRAAKRWVCSQGYAHVIAPGHPAMAPYNGRVAEHRLVMEQQIGRYLLPKETVHHRNGVRTDNRPENLELWSSAHPMGQRVTDKVEWALWLLQTYAPEHLR